ncbi:MAG: class I SAM-dependent methyltransferase [Syntrophaceae bacterium]|nr:class I SAM-dependent methyltransferase [Syntrophaceae bacterium]
MGDDFLSKSQTKRLLDELKRLEQFRKLNRILEIGPGKGWFLEQANKLGWETWAVEVNSKALERLKAIGIHRIINDEESLNQILEESFDVVRIWDVLEHLESPKKTLAMSFNALRKAGIIKISTTNFRSLSRIVNGPNWVYLNGADHIVLFEPKTIDRMFREVGFSRIKVRTRSFNLRKKLYHPPEDLTKIPILIKPFRKLIDEAIQFTKYGHQLIVEAIKY